MQDSQCENIDVENLRKEIESKQGKLNKLLYANIQRVILDINKKLQDKNSIIETKKETKKHKEIQSIIVKLNLYGDWIKLISAITGEEFHEANHRKVNYYEKFAVIVLEQNPNNHNYPLNEPLIIASSSLGMAMDKNGKFGNSVPYRSTHPEASRYATVDEIIYLLNTANDKFYEELKKQIK